MHGCSSPLGQVLFFKLRVIRANTQVEVADLSVLGVLTNLIIKTIQVLSSPQGQTEMSDRYMKNIFLKNSNKMSRD